MAEKVSQKQFYCSKVWKCDRDVIICRSENGGTTVQDQSSTLQDQSSTVQDQSSTVQDQSSTVQDQSSTVQDHVEYPVPVGIQGSLRGLRRDFPVCSRSAEYPVPMGIQGSLRGLRRDFPVCSRSAEYPVPVGIQGRLMGLKGEFPVCVERRSVANTRESYLSNVWCYRQITPKKFWRTRFGFVTAFLTYGPHFRF